MGRAVLTTLPVFKRAPQHGHGATHTPLSVPGRKQRPHPSLASLKCARWKKRGRSAKSPPAHKRGVHAQYKGRTCRDGRHRSKEAVQLALARSAHFPRKRRGLNRLPAGPTVLRRLLSRLASLLLAALKALDGNQPLPSPAPEGAADEAEEEARDGNQLR